MRRIIPLTLSVCALHFAGASPVRQIRTIDTREPADHALSIMHGESIDLRIRLLNYGSPVDLRGWSVVLHGQTNGQAVTESYQFPGTAGLRDDPSAAAQGWASVPLDVSAWWPADASSGRWTLMAVSPPPAVRIMRAGGPLTVRGSAAAGLQAPLPQSVTAALRAEWLADLAGATNTLAASIRNSISIAGDLLATSNALAIARQAGDAANSNHVSQALGHFSETGTVYKAELADRARDANMADWAAEAMQAYGLAFDSPDGEALAALKSHPADPAAHPDIRAIIAAATNELVTTYLLGNDAWMVISNKTLSIGRTTNDVPVVLWSSSGSTGASGVDTNLVAALQEAIAGKADKAWGKYAPDGSPNPESEYMVFLNTPAIMHASGLQWATCGAYGVLAQSGAVAFTTVTNGEVRWGLDLQTNYIALVRGGSIVVGAAAQSITVADGEATIVYPYSGGDFPVLWYSPALNVPFTIQEGVVWTDRQDGTAAVIAPAEAPRGFWYATSTAEIDGIVDIHMATRLTGGLFGAPNAPPVYYDSTITISSGGKSYRIPAEAVK